jgi:hypothetical protein
VLRPIYELTIFVGLLGQRPWQPQPLLLSYLARSLSFRLCKLSCNLFGVVFYSSRNCSLQFPQGFSCPFTFQLLVSFPAMTLHLPLRVLPASTQQYSSFNMSTTTSVTAFPLQHNHPHTCPFYSSALTAPLLQLYNIISICSNVVTPCNASIHNLQQPINVVTTLSRPCNYLRRVIPKMTKMLE